MEGYWLYVWEDETSQFDPEGYWIYGCECYMRTYEVWIPNWIEEGDKKAIDDFLEKLEN